MRLFKSLEHLLDKIIFISEEINLTVLTYGEQIYHSYSSPLGSCFHPVWWWIVEIVEMLILFPKRKIVLSFEGKIKKVLYFVG